MKLLSIHWGSNSTAALLVDGAIVACVSQERFSRIKNDERYPRQAIEAVLEIGGLDSTKLYQAFITKKVAAHMTHGRPQNRARAGFYDSIAQNWPA